MKKVSSFASPFPNLITAAHYDPFYLTVNFDSITMAQYQALGFPNVTVDNYKTLALIRHEMIHWIDHISTLWGQKKLVMLLNAMNAWANGEEDQFWRIKSLDLNYSADTLADYYTESYMDHKGSFTNPWRYQHSCGVRFGLDGKPLLEKPLLFTKFHTYNREPISRVPVSIASILETNAIQEEFKLKASFINSIGDPFEKAIQLGLVKKELESLLYRSELTLYSVAAHLVATPNGITDIFKTYDISSSLGTLLLNMPPNILSKAKYNPIGNNVWDQRATSMIKNADVGFGYYNLISNLVTTFGKDSYSLENILQASGLPDPKTLALETVSEMTLNQYELIPGPFTFFGTHLLNMGVEIFSKRGLDGKKASIDDWLTEERFYPDFIFSDQIVDTSKVDEQKAIAKLFTTGEIGLEERFALFEKLEDKMSGFVAICGV